MMNTRLRGEALMLWENLREEEFGAAIERSGGLCVLPIGCIEKHGQHLPVGTDYIEAREVCEAAAELSDVVIFPTGAWLGEVSCFHAFNDAAERRYLGCIGIKQETILTVLSELCDEIARNGFRKILIVNCHGGNIALLNHFLRCQSYEKRGYATLVTFALDFKAMKPMNLIARIRNDKEKFPDISRKDIEVLKALHKTGYGGGHGDFRESALIMANHPEFVRLDRFSAESGASRRKTDYLTDLGVASVNSWLANFPASLEATVDPSGASSAIGRAMIRVSAERLAKIFDVIKADEDCVSLADME